MPLTLVLGPANSAKAAVVLGAYRLAAQRDALLVVPTALDAAHYDRELARTAPTGVLLGRPLTFPALVDEIAQRTSYSRRRLSPLQRERVLRSVIARTRCSVLGESARGPGFALAAGRLIAELAQARVGSPRLTAALRSWAQGAPERAAYAEDLAAIVRGYARELEAGERVDAEMFAWGALDSLREHPERWSGAPVFLYGFDDLTPIELDVVQTLALRVGAAVTVSLTYEPGRAALAARATVVEQLREHAQTVTVLPALADHYAPRARLALHHLERHLFEQRPEPVDPGPAVALLEAGGERAEAELIAAEALRALREGVPPEEIVVVCRSLQRSGALLEATLRRYGIPAASSRRLPLEHTALGRAVLALVRCASCAPAQVSVADLLHYLRAPAAHPEPDAVDRLEAELRRGGIARLGELTGAGQRRAAAPALRALERLRAAHDPLPVLTELTRELMLAPHTGRARVLDGDEQRELRAGEALLRALGELAELDGDRRAQRSTEGLLELLAGVELPAGAPPGPGEVLVAEPLAIRARRFARVFVTGLCDGEFPRPPGGGDPFLGGEQRRELALASGLALAPEPDSLARERYLLYACVSRATERVYLSYRSADEDGNLVAPSPFLEEVERLFTAGWRASRCSRLLADVVWPEDQAPTERERVLARAAGAGLAAGTAPEPDGFVQLSPAALANLRHTHTVSAGALETFAACPVRWLIERQLRSRDLEPEAEPLARGAFIHAVLERVFAGLDTPLGPSTLAAARGLLGRAMSDSEHAVAPAQAPEVRAAILHGIEAELDRYLRHEAAERRGWATLETELHFGLEDAPFEAVGLGEGEEAMLLAGVIDRIDARSGAAVVRDYKSGSVRSSWPGARWISDHQLQVGLYMIAVRRLLDLRPVAGFYQPLSGPDLRPRGAFSSDAALGGERVQSDRREPVELEALLDEIEREAV
ncbi:MAG: PD-(D/E)XK nuclease family protein, partial [Solirubrobacteraceae bacterium]